MKKLKKMILNDPVVMSGEEMKGIKGGYGDCSSHNACNSNSSCIINGSLSPGSRCMQGYKDIQTGPGNGTYWGMQSIYGCWCVYNAHGVH